MRQATFRRYFIGSLVSNLGTWLQNTAQVLLAYQLTRSVFAVGVIACAQFAGVLLVAPWAAVLADRIGSQRTLIGTQVISAVIAGSMALRYASGMLGMHSLVTGALALGLAFSLASLGFRIRKGNLSRKWEALGFCGSLRGFHRLSVVVRKSPGVAGLRSLLVASQNCPSLVRRVDRESGPGGGDGGGAIRSPHREGLCKSAGERIDNIAAYREAAMLA